MPSGRGLGVAQILLSGVCFGLLAYLGKLAFLRGFTGGELLSFRFLLGGVSLAALLLVQNPRQLKISRGHMGRCALLGIFGYAIFSSCYFVALKGLSASLTVLLLYTYPLQVAGGAWLFFGERIGRERWIALPLVMLGLCFLIWGDFYVLDSTALLFGFASAVFYSFYILASSRWLKDLDAKVAVVYIQLAAGVALAALNWRDPAHVGHLVRDNLFLLIVIAWVCSVAAMVLFLSGLKKLRGWEVSILSTAEPVTGIFLAIILLNERFSGLQILGAVAVLLAFFVVAWPRPIAGAERPQAVS